MNAEGFNEYATYALLATLIGLVMRGLVWLWKNT